MYSVLPKQVRSRSGFMGCLASIELGGEYVNPTTDALVPSTLVVSGCEGQ
jgi:neurexin